MHYGTAVRVRYHGPTDFRGSRFSAVVLTGSLDGNNSPAIFQSFDHAKTSTQQMRDLAMMAVHKEFGATHEPNSYAMLNSSDYVFIF